MKLDQLPLDLLRLVTAHLHYLDVANLCFTGSRALNSKFANGGVVELEIWFNSRVRPLRWPLFFSQLAHLSRFSLKNSMLERSLPQVTLLLSHIPHTLLYLNLDISGSFSALQSLLEHRPNALPVLHELEICVDADEARDFSITHCWPLSIARLVVTHYSTRHLHLTPSSLPPNLTFLNGGFCKIVDTPNNAFPRSVTELHLSVSRITCDIVPLLPSGLKTLLFWVNDYEDPEDPDPRPHVETTYAWARTSISKLPRTLTGLSWPADEITRDEVLQLPPNLTHLSDTIVAPDDYHLLPLSLTSLGVMSPCTFADPNQHIPPNMRYIEVEAAVLAHLKPVISDLSVYVRGQNDLLEKELEGLGLREISSQIAALRVEVIEKFPFKCLPNTLTSLSFDLGTLTCGHIENLPRSLKKLDLFAGRMPMEAEAWKLLPPLLETFSIQEIHSLSLESSLFMPRGMKDLRIRDCNRIDLDWFEGLPTGMQILEVPLNFVAFPGEWKIQLPTTLEQFTLHATFPVQYPDKCHTAVRNIFASLPPGLQELKLWENWPPNVKIPYTAADIQLLPKRLVTLCIPPLRSDRLSRRHELRLPWSLQSTSIFDNQN